MTDTEEGTSYKGYAIMGTREAGCVTLFPLHLVLGLKSAGPAVRQEKRLCGRGEQRRPVLVRGNWSPHDMLEAAPES